ncbi:hypothetical protein HLPCO_000641 [Haloplasma contractile SSD-17B]|uniref:Uncharacterized protein n=1 Tax=Haloplasma contractile SSD-17B TaxID=1033810 RepID=U2DXQ5_9MOLU|nr:hypothetical protein HLPCO_000641 [Haloplasma contractile SSD-17B]
MKQLLINYLLCLSVVIISVFIRFESSSLTTKLISYTSIGLAVLSLVVITYNYITIRPKSIKRRQKKY